MLKKLLEKWSCKHKWQIHHKANIYGSGYDMPTEIRHTLICENCGKIKQISL